LSLQCLEHVLETAGAAEAENRRQVEWECDRAANRRELRTQARDDRARALRRIRAFLIGLEADDEERLVR
jgi:hypothetical protein